MSARPLIGLSTSQPTEAALGRLFNGTSLRYMQALNEVGALPLMLPTLPELAQDYAARVDAVLLTGGVDLHPRYFGQEPRRGLGVTDEQRDAFEEALYREARRLGKPVFGICRGIQVINAFEGGTLHQHLPEEVAFWVDHSQQASPPALGHSVNFAEGSLLERQHGARAWVNSYHHQALDQLAPTLRATATASDGLIEAVEGDGVVAVQWHPELLFQEHPYALGTFRAFMALLG